MSKQPTRDQLAAQIFDLQGQLQDLAAQRNAAQADCRALSAALENLKRERDRALDIVLRQAENANAKATGTEVMAFLRDAVLPMIHPLLVGPEQAGAAKAAE